MSYRYIVTKQNKDGSFDEVGMNNRTIIDGLSTYGRTFRHRINPFGNGKVVRVEVYYGSNIYGKPIETFVSATTKTK